MFVDETDVSGNQHLIKQNAFNAIALFEKVKICINHGHNDQYAYYTFLNFEIITREFCYISFSMWVY